MRLDSGMLKVLGAVVAVTASAVPTVAQEAVDEELVRLNQELFEQVLVERDSMLFRDVAFPEFRVIPPGGLVETKEEVIAGLESTDISQIKIEDVEVLRRGNTAVVIGKLTITGVIRPVGQLRPLRFMSVFLQEVDEWRLLSRSLVQCMPLAIERGRC